MISPKVKKWNETKAELEWIEESIKEELASLPSAFGFDSLKSFVRALKKAGRSPSRGKKRDSTPKRRKRAKITDAVRAKVGRLVKSRKTGSEIAKALKISLPSVANIKKALGLTRTGKKPAPRAKVRRASANPASVAKARKRRVASKKPAASESKPTQASPVATSAS